MAYDQSKDRLVHHVGTISTNGTDIHVELMRYNGGQVKTNLRRVAGEKHLKLGRLSQQESVELGRLLSSLTDTDFGR